jgi:AAA15 family ATPase/GTPase
MLIEFKVANYRSFREEQTFSLVASNADKELPSRVIDIPLPGMTGIRYLKGAAIYGANASGKSNLLNALRFVANFVEKSATRIQPGDDTGAEPFKLDAESIAKPSQFEVTFVSDGIRYVFGFSANRKRVTEEYLIAYPKGSPQRWYQRNYDSEANRYVWARPSSAFKQDKSLQDKTRENSLFLSVGPQFNHPQLTRVFKWFKNSLRCISLSAEDSFAPIFTAKRIQDPNYHDRIISLLRSADFGIDDARVRERDVSVDELKQHVPQSVLSRLEKEHGSMPGKAMEIELTHLKQGGQSITLSFNEEESAGTRRYFSLIGPWTDILDHGYTVFIDEIDTSLHPLLVKELLELLFSDKNNTKGAQVVFTSHNPFLIDSSLIRRDQIWFTEKEASGATRLYPLTQYQPRNDEALAKGYLAGRYGAIPSIEDGLKQ